MREDAVSLEVSKRSVELQRMMQGFFGFALCFLMLLLIWYPDTPTSTPTRTWLLVDESDRRGTRRHG